FGAGHGLPQGGRVRAGRASRCAAGLRRLGHGGHCPRWAGPWSGVPHRSGQRVHRRDGPAGVQRGGHGQGCQHHFSGGVAWRCMPFLLPGFMFTQWLESQRGAVDEETEIVGWRDRRPSTRQPIPVNDRSRRCPPVKRKLFYAPLSIVVSVAAMMFAPVANAQQDHQLASPSQEKHCAVRIDPVKPGQTSSTMGKPRCFGTFAEAIYAATNRTVRLPAGAHILTQSEAVAPTTVTVLSVDYVDANYKGNTYVWYTEIASGCYGYNYSADSMPSGWNDVVSSNRVTR